MWNQRHRLKNKMTEIQCSEDANTLAPQINRSQSAEPSREQIEKECFANIIEELRKNDPYDSLR